MVGAVLWWGARTPAKGRCMSDLVLTDAMVLTMDGDRRVYASGYVWIRDGRIHRVGGMRDLPELAPGTRVRSLGGSHLVMPGLVNTHTHISSFGLRAMQDQGPQGYPGVKMYDGLRALDGPGGYLGAASALHEGNLGGITTTVAGEAGTAECLSAALEACHDSGSRVVMSRAAMDSDVSKAANLVIPEDLRETVDDALTGLDALRSQVRSDLVSVVPEAFSVMRTTADMMVALRDYAEEHGLHLLMHAGATENERNECLERTGKRIAHYLADLDVLRPRTLLAHGTWLDEEEIALVADSGAGIAHCPMANGWSGNRISAVSDWLEAGVRVGLGTDGPTSSNSQDLWAVAKAAVYFQKTRLRDIAFGSPELALELLTIKGAESIGMADEIGSLEPGKAADLICVDIERTSLAPRASVVSNLVYAHDRSAVRHVYVAGDEIVRDGVHLRLDGRSLAAEISDWAEAALPTSGLLGHFRAVSPFTYAG